MRYEFEAVVKWSEEWPDDELAAEGGGDGLCKTTANEINTVMGGAGGFTGPFEIEVSMAPSEENEAKHD